MSRVPKWKIEKHKVKVVFRLQFHATNIPSTGWDKLFLSFISADTGKVTAKTNKANVRNGSCKWPDPIYEATRLLQDPRTKTYDDKLYKLVVAMGTSRSSILGEVDVNLAEFAEALKPASIALSLRGSDSGTLLHITAQLLTTKTGFREFEQQRETGARSSQQLLNQRSHDPAEVAAASSDMGTDKVNARIKLKETSLGFPLVEDSAGSTEDYENSSHTSDGIFTEKYDPCGAHEISSFRSPGDLPLCPTSQSPTPEKGARWGKQLSSPGSNDWTHGWSPEYYADKDLTAAHDENSRLTTRLEVAESAFSQLKTETTSLEHVTDKLGTETKGLAQQLAVELMSRNQLTTEVSLLRTECSNLKEELEEIKSSKLLQKKSDAEGNTMGKHGNDILAADPVHQLQTEWLQGLLLLESKLQQTRNNALHGLQASDLDFLLADLGALQRVIENLKQGVLPGQMKENHYAEHLVPLPNTAHLSNSGHHDTLKKSSGGRTGTMEEKMCELLQKLEDSKTEKENLLEKMSQMERYYESFIHKLEESQKQTAIELENLRKEHNSCFYTVSVLQAQKQKMHEEMNDQLMRFVEDRTALESQNKELERRAAATETALKRVRFNYSAAVERLQKDLELLSFQVLSMYESNEALAKQSFLEDCDILPEEHSAVADLCGNKEPEPQVFLEGNGTLDKMDGQKNLRAFKIEELRARSEFHVHSNTDSRGNHSNMGGKKRASCAMESELLEMFIANIECQIFSDVLHESHYAALDIIKCMQGRLHMLEMQLHDSNDAKQSLVLKLNSALDEAKSVRESEAGYILKCDDLIVKNQILEAKLHDITVENTLFMEKLTELERLIQEHKACESKYMVCTEERERFENLLIKERLLTDQLKDELRSLRERFEAMKDELDKQSSVNNDIRMVSTSLQDQLGELCSKFMSFNKEVNISGLDEASLLHELQSKNYAGVMKSLEFFHQQTCNKVLHVQQEKEVVVKMCDALQRRSENAESELYDMKQKYACDLDATKQKLNFSEELVEKLQQELQDMANKLRISSDSQEKYSITISGLTSKLSQMEIELLRATRENEALVAKMKEFSSTVEELDRTKMSLAQYEEDAQTLTQSLQSKDEMIVHMESEIKHLHDDLRCTDENLLREKSLKEELESTLASLTSQLGEKDQVLLSFDDHRTESMHLKDQLLDMEKANSIMQDALSQSEQIQRDLNCKNHSLHSQLSNLENQLGIVLEAMLSSEIEASYMRSQVREAVVQLNMLRNDFEKLQLKNNDADELLRVHMSTQAELTDRNSALQAAIHSLEINLCSVVQEKKGLEEIMKGHEEAFTKVSNNSHDAAVDNSEKIFEDQNEVSLRVLLTDLEEQIDNVKSTKDENEILNIILRSKLEEQHTMMSSLLQNQRQELTNLIEENKDLTQKLAEQSLKAEEFKNLSIHLRELKEKAEAGRKEKEGSLHAMQDSLRIAFIKEQYESKVQELKGQVFVNKKYAEEMLLKLQSALDDVETGKKNEIALAKKIEELSMKISEMEVEMQDLSADKRELSNAYDSMMTELECTKLNLDCCNEEKQKIELSFDECNEERNRIRVELDLVKKLLKNMALTDNNTSCNSYGSGTPGATSIGNILGDAKAESASRATPNKIEMDPELQEHEIQSRSLTSNLSRADDAGKLGEDEVSKNLELERLKNENMSHLLPLDVNLIDPSLSGLERTLSQLDMANEHLQSIFPSFKELPGSGNALERVLALELELAEALQAKKKTDILFQSSFLKQHSDEAAVFQSFRDINELIQDTIELKRRQVAVESELKEMQGRYSELSVQFAEVEGERQKLEMNLKNRSPWNS
ncbi:hypothetical protein HU200_043679 [Digitaria exilis]|uniref:C2 NT-type domain-containing protein n=1 Tax=Digitaria exilis TaxID=1010633 RepID=A0A835B5L4_9POAL|nr:hypothetical protein HU200_043679 [Digitaria exilis]